MTPEATPLPDGFPTDADALRAHFRAAAETSVDVPPPDPALPWTGARLRSAFAQVGKTGLFRFGVPKAYGGLDASCEQMVAALEGLGDGCHDVGLGFVVTEQLVILADTLRRFGTPEQNSRWLPGLAKGTVIGGQALTEPEAGSDVMAAQTTAMRTADGYRLSGRKTLIGLASVADVMVVVARTDPAKGAWGLSAFLVEPGDIGFAPSDPQATMGLTPSMMGDITLTDCDLPADRLLGTEGSGWLIIQHCLQTERAFIFASQVGAMARQLRAATRFARARQSGGNAIIQHQSVSNRLADMALRLETSQLMLRKAARMADARQNLMKHSAMTKLHISESFAANSLDAMRITGGKAYLAEHGIERDLRDSLGGLLYAGTSDIQRQIIARLLD